MSTIIWTFIGKICWLLLSLRYRIQIKGLEQLSKHKFANPGGILFLPNHPAMMDPLFLYLLLWPRFRMRPLVIEYIYRIPLLRPVMKLVKGLPIPNFDTSVNQLKVRKAELAIKQIAEGLKRGQNFVLYPAGKLKSSGREILGGASGAHAILQECPDANVIVVRTTGLWGSSFSRAITGRSPDLVYTLLQGIKTLLKNGIFFSPRRTVEIEIKANPEGLPIQGTRVEFNRFLENWYNRYPDELGKIRDEEPLKLVSYSRWRNDFLEPFQPKKKRESSGDVQISSETQTKIYGEIRKILDNPGMQIAPEMNLAADLGMDSLNMAEMIVFLAREFNVEELHPEDIETVSNILEIAEGARVSERTVKKTGMVHWPKEKNRPDPQLPLGRIMPEAFLHSCDRMGPFVACGDDLVGVLTYKKMKRAVLVLAMHFSKMKEEKIAILLPASVGAYLLILAIQCAGKVPVMLNWTLGPRYLDEMMKASGAKTAISSWRFLERLSHVEFGDLIDQIQLVEDIRENLSFTTKLRGAFLSLFSAKAICRALSLGSIDENHLACILFTSGTEANPKGVPLSHLNILSNERAAMQCIDLRSSDVMYGILPPFHSFGFSVAGIFAFLSGMRIAFYPDPTDSFALAEGIERWKATIFCSAPSFLKGLFSAAKSSQLKTVRYFVTGAEKAAPDLFAYVEKLRTGAVLIEGYGITECSPILTLTRPNLPPKGVGSPIPGIEVCTIHPETLALLPPGSEGEVCVRGPNVFHGYLGSPRSPFIELEGKSWYRTGDIGYFDVDNNLILSGRLKRFTKIGGEMISLAAIEGALINELVKRGQLTMDFPTLAVCADERNLSKQPQLIVFTTVSLDKETANEILKNSGLSRLIKISQVKKIEEIPMMGTGKTDYRRLQSYV